MRRFLQVAILATVALSTTAAFAEDETVGGGVSEAQAVSLNKGTLKDESIGLKPEVGAFLFQDNTANQTARGAIGVGFDANFSHILSGVAQNTYFGISTGGLWSHLGASGSNFFGYNSPGGTTAGANLFMVPGDVKLGYNVQDNLRISAHGGVNLMYNSQPSSINWGSATSRNWNIMPNVGADIDFGLSKNVVLTLRPDWTFTPGVGIFTGIIEFGVALG